MDSATVRATIASALAGFPATCNNADGGGTFIVNRSADWLDQAKTDLKHAENSAAAGDHDWACFAAQQAAEKAVKALHLYNGTVTWGHSVLDLIDELPDDLPVADELKNAARILDRHYIASRYPDAYPNGSARRYYTAGDAAAAVAEARKVVSWCDEMLSRRPPGSPDTAH